MYRGWIVRVPRADAQVWMKAVLPTECVITFGPHLGYTATSERFTMYVVVDTVNVAKYTFTVRTGFSQSEDRIVVACEYQGPERPESFSADQAFVTAGYKSTVCRELRKGPVREQMDALAA